MILAELHFPPIDEILRWKPFIGEDGDWYAFNKVTLIAFMAAGLTLLIFFVAGSKAKRSLVPTGIQNVAETSVEFIQEQIVLQTMGEREEDLKWTWYLLALFLFVMFCNATEVIPFIQMPATARMAIPLFLALVSWIAFIFMGFKKNGGHYLKQAVVPPGVPKALLPLAVLIEVVSTFLVRPFSLAVRLFANMLAGHLLLVTFGVMGHALMTAETKQFLLVPMTILPFLLFIAITVFEVLVIVLQAYIFTILTAVYLGGAMHPEH